MDWSIELQKEIEWTFPNLVSEEQSMIHPPSRTGEANIAYERQIAGKNIQTTNF